MSVRIGLVELVDAMVAMTIAIDPLVLSSLRSPFLIFLCSSFISFFLFFYISSFFLYSNMTCVF